MSVTESPTSKKWGKSSNNQSIQIGDPSGQMLKNVEKNVAFIHFWSNIHDFNTFISNRRQISTLRAKANIWGKLHHFYVCNTAEII